MKKIALASLMIFAVLAASGCTVKTYDSFGNESGTVMNGSQVQVEYGKLLAARVTREVQVNNSQANQLGSALIGGAIGAGLGNAIGHGKARKNAAMIGAGLGALSGASGAAQARNTPGVIAYTVQKDDGTTVLINQMFERVEEIIQPGLRVMVQTTGNELLVFPAVEPNFKKKG